MLSQELRSQVQYVDVLIIGSGPAGMAAAIAAREAGVENLLVLERENEMGGMHYSPFRYYKYKEGLLRPDGQPGFMTPTGRYELYCTLFESFGDDPLPYYQEPPTSCQPVRIAPEPSK